MPLSRGSGGYGPPATYTPPPDTGLIFPSNSAAGGDIQLVWSGANLLPRYPHTAVWSINHVQQSGYYAVAWHLPTTGLVADGGWPGNAYCYGTHPYPSAAGAVNGAGSVTDGVVGGSVHYYEIAGLGASDFLASPSSPGPQTTFPVTKGVWVKQARTAVVVNVSGTDYVRHTFYPDLSDPSVFIQQDLLKSSVDAISPASPRFNLGASPWTVIDTTANEECPSGTLRNILLFNAALTGTECASEANGTSQTTAATSAGQAATWYINRNPTPGDITDKSSAGHTPSWANSNRPTLYTA